MYLDINTDKEYKMLSAKIALDPMESPTKLYNLAKQLKIRHPAVDFSSAAKRGEYNDLSDKEYEQLLNQQKALSILFKDENDPDGKVLSHINIFLLLERLLNHYILDLPTIIANNKLSW